MENTKKKAKIWIVISVAMLLISVIGTSFVQTSGGRVDMREITFKTDLGVHMTGWLFVPDGVDAENPAPGIAVSHGMFNNRGMQDLNFVELSRRGFVVFAIDMLSHGDSGHVEVTGGILQGMNQAVLMLSRIKYVDNARIGIQGHSLGGMNSNVAVGIDNDRDVPLISAVLLNSADATYTVEDVGFVNIYGNRHVGIVAPMYEEFFMLDIDVDGNVTSPTEFIYNNNAQSFLHFGQDPSDLEMRTPETMYREVIDGVEAIRIIYNPGIIHPWAHFSSQATYATIEFFEVALGAPNAMAPFNQVWQWKVAFNMLGLVGIGIFLTNFVVLMSFTRFFESLRAMEEVEPKSVKGKNLAWFITSLLAGGIFGALTYLPILRATDAFRHSTESFRQTQTFGMAVWALACAGFAVVSMAIYYFTVGKKDDFDLKKNGICHSWGNIGKTLVLALFSVVVFFGIVFLADFFFTADFRLWVVAIRPFRSWVVTLALIPYMLFFIIFFVVNSIFKQF